MKRFLFWLVVSCCIVGFTASDNPDFFTRVVHNFMVLRQARMQEKVWLHTDRPSYHAGDTIRFRAFLVDAATHRPSPYSRFVYVDLVNRRDSVLKKVKLAFCFCRLFKGTGGYSSGGIFFAELFLLDAESGGRLYL